MTQVRVDLMTQVRVDLMTQVRVDLMTQVRVDLLAKLVYNDRLNDSGARRLTYLLHSNVIGAQLVEAHIQRLAVLRGGNVVLSKIE
jgi:hypothetical protein